MQLVLVRMIFHGRFSARILGVLAGRLTVLRDPADQPDQLRRGDMQVLRGCSQHHAAPF